MVYYLKMFSLAIIVTPNSAQKKKKMLIAYNQLSSKQPTKTLIYTLLFILALIKYFFLVFSSLSLARYRRILLVPSNTNQWKTLGTTEKKNERANYERMMNSNEISTRQSITYDVTRNCGNVCAHILSLVPRPENELTQATWAHWTYIQNYTNTSPERNSSQWNYVHNKASKWKTRLIVIDFFSIIFLFNELQTFSGD